MREHNTPFTWYNRLSKPVVQPVWQPAVSCRQTSNRLWKRLSHRFDKHGLTTVLNNAVWQPCWMNSCSFNQLSNRVVQPVWQPAVYTIQPVVNPVWQPVWQQVVSCKRGFNVPCIGLHTMYVCNIHTFKGNFWATVSKTVRPMLSVRCLSCLSVCLSVCLWRSCTVAKRLDRSRRNLACW